MQPGRARTSGLGVALLPLARWVGRVAPLRPIHGVWVLSCPSAALRVRGVPGLLAPVHRCARAVCCVVSAVSWATWLLFTGAPARCGVLRVRRPGPLGSRSPVCPLGVLCCVCGVLGHLAPVHRFARSVCCSAYAVSWVTWLLFTGVPALSFVLFVRCPGSLGSCSPMCPRRLLCCVCGVLGHLAPVHRCARSVWCVACAASRAPWLPFIGVPAGCVVLPVRCPGPLGPCSPVRPLGVLLCVRGVLSHLAPVHRCACSVFCFVCAVRWDTWLLFTGVPAPFVVLCVRCPGPLGSCSPLCPLGVLCCVCGVLGPLAPVHRCVPARCVVLRVWCPAPLGSCSPVRPLGVLLCVRGVLGYLAPVHRCARSVCCFVCAVSWASWLLFTGVPGCGVASPCCPCCRRVCGVLALVAPLHWGARCLRCTCAVGGCVPLPPPLIFLLLFSVFFLKSKKKGRAYTAGTGTGSRCSGAIVLCPLARVVGALAAVAPQGCGSRVLMYTGMGQGGFG